MRRRSVSSLVSPGPRVPMPPPRRDSAAEDPPSRQRYLILSSSTCSLPSASGAVGEDVHEELVRSSPSTRSLLQIAQLCGRRSLSKMPTSTAGLAACGRQRGTLPLREKCESFFWFLEHAPHDVGPRGGGESASCPRMFGLEWRVERLTAPRARRARAPFAREPKRARLIEDLAPVPRDPPHGHPGTVRWITIVDGTPQ